MLEFGRLSVDGLIKAGLFDNYVEQSTGVSLQKVVNQSQATTRLPCRLTAICGGQRPFKIVIQLKPTECDHPGRGAPGARQWAGRFVR
jgi:hypothetical protein